MPLQASEALLQRMTALYVASHYRNTPNDLQLAADAPAHTLFVLLGPVDEAANVMPDVLVAVQVALEGAISKGSAQASLAHGNLPQARRAARAPCVAGALRTQWSRIPRSHGGCDVHVAGRLRGRLAAGCGAV